MRDSANDKDEEQKDTHAMSYMRHYVGGNWGRRRRMNARKRISQGRWRRVKTLRKQGRALSLKLHLVSRGWNWITRMDKQSCIRVHIVLYVYVCVAL